MRTEVSTAGSIGNALRLSHLELVERSQVKVHQEIYSASLQCIKMLNDGEIPNEDTVCRKLFAVKKSFDSKDSSRSLKSINQNFSFKANFKGFIISIIDSVPSEIATISLENLHFSGNWNTHMTKDTSCVISIGWVQIDNHCPNVSYPVALRPVENRAEIYNNQKDGLPSAFITFVFRLAPCHSSGILVST